MLRLTADGLEPVDLDAWDDGMADTGVEVGAPSARDVVNDRPGAHGSSDRTTLVGARVITVSVSLAEGTHSRQALLDRMGPYMLPGRRITLHHRPAGGRVRRFTVRPDPADVPWVGATLSDLVWTFRTVGAPWALGEQRTVDLVPAPPPPGRSYDLVRPRAYPDAPVMFADAVNAGGLPADWTWTIEGPVRRPRLRNETTGDEVVLRGLELLAGQTAVVTSADHAVLVDGQARYSAIDHATTTWWQVPPGTSVVSMPVTSAAGDAAGTLTYADTFYA